MKNIIDHYYSRLEENPERIILRHKDRGVTLSEIELLSNKLANLISVKFAKQKYVPVLLDNEVNYLISMISIWKANKVYVPLNSNTPEDRLENILETIGISMLLTNVELDYSCKLEIIDFDDYTSYDINPCHKIKLEETEAYILSTSGSTGIPKLVVATHENLYWFLKEMDSIVPFGSDSNFLISTPVAFDVSFHELLSWVVGNGVITIIDGNSAIEKYKCIPTYLIDHNITHAALSPTVFKSIGKMLGSNLESIQLEHLLLAGEELRSEVVSSIFSNNSINIYNFYGPTETTIYATYKLITKLSDKIPIGLPLNGVDILLVDENNMICSEKGELLIGGFGVTNGYLNNSELNNQKYVDYNNKIYYKTGDFVYYKGPDLVFDGRKDNQVKINGMRVELSEIDCFIQKFDNSISGYTIYYNKEIISFVTGLSSESCDLISFLTTKLPRYMVPTRVLSIKDFPISSNGKINLAMLKEMYDNDRINKLNRREINSQVDEYLEVFSTILEMEVHYDDELLQTFALDSLGQVELIVALEYYFDCEIDNNILFIHTSPRTIREYIIGLGNDNREIYENNPELDNILLPYILDNIHVNNIKNIETFMHTETYYLQKCYYHDNFSQVLHDTVLLPDEISLEEVNEALNAILRTNTQLNTCLDVKDNTLYFKQVYDNDYTLRHYPFENSALISCIKTYLEERPFEILAYFMVSGKIGNRVLNLFINHHICDQSSLNILKKKIADELLHKIRTEPQNQYSDFINYQNSSLVNADAILNDVYNLGFSDVTEEKLLSAHEIQYIEFDNLEYNLIETIIFINYIMMQSIMNSHQLDIISAGTLVDIRKFKGCNIEGLVSDVHTTLPLISSRNESIEAFTCNFMKIYELALSGCNINHLLYFDYPNIKLSHKKYEKFIDDNQKVSTNYIGGVKVRDIRKFVKEVKKDNEILKTFSLTKHYVTCFKSNNKLIIVPLNSVLMDEGIIESHNGRIVYE